ncbi:hypothetical protein ACOSQ3_004235 [Xanthoceras sorbifolium]
MKWGMNIVGKMPVATGGKVYMLAVTDYFTKWVEAESYVRNKDTEVKSFIWNNWKIKLSYSNPRYPLANGQAESTNKTIISTLKKWLDKYKGKWADELQGVL